MEMTEERSASAGGPPRNGCSSGPSYRPAPLINLLPSFPTRIIKEDALYPTYTTTFPPFPSSPQTQLALARANPKPRATAVFPQPSGKLRSKCSLLNLVSERPGDTTAGNIPRSTHIPFFSCLTTPSATTRSCPCYYFLLCLNMDPNPVIRLAPICSPFSPSRIGPFGKSTSSNRSIYEPGLLQDRASRPLAVGAYKNEGPEWKQTEVIENCSLTEIGNITLPSRPGHCPSHTTPSSIITPVPIQGA